VLVLSRQKSEEVVFTFPDGRRGVLTVVEIRGDKVRFGVEFPKDIGINRREVQDAIDKEFPPKD
jgi:carbon storage regulator